MNIIACYSNKGGVGKTAVAVNLAYALAADGARVLLCDLDPQGASSFYFRVKPSKKLTDTSFFKDVKKFTDAIRAAITKTSISSLPTWISANSTFFFPACAIAARA